jgi:hypothetical protein
MSKRTRTRQGHSNPTKEKNRRKESACRKMNYTIKVNFHNLDGNTYPGLIFTKG